MSELKAEPGKILRRWDTTDGWTVLSVPHTAVPNYDFEKVTEGMTEDQIQREVLLNWSVVVGRAVWPEFNYDRHVALDPIEFDPETPLHVGWDWGGCPAFVPTQLNSFGQWLIFPSLSPPDTRTTGVYEFAQEVADHLLREYAAPNGMGLEDLKLVHIGDPNGAGRPPRTGQRRQELRSCFEILRRGIDIYTGDEEDAQIAERRPGWGWNVIPGAVNITARLEAVRSRLTTMLQGGLSAMVVDPRATTVIEGMGGSYAYKQYSDGTYSRDPDKSYWSHTCDAMGYVGTRLFARPTRQDRDEDDERRSTFISGAAPRWQRGY